MTIYRGFTISPVIGGGYTWEDEDGEVRWFSDALKAPYATEELAMNAIDAYKREKRAAGQ